MACLLIQELFWVRNFQIIDHPAILPGIVMSIERTQADYLQKAGIARTAIKRLTELGSITPEKGGELLFAVYQKTIDVDNTRNLLHKLSTDPTHKTNTVWDFSNVHTPWQFLDTLTEEGYLDPDLLREFNNSVDEQRKVPLVETQNQSSMAKASSDDAASLRGVLQLEIIVLEQKHFLILS